MQFGEWETAQRVLCVRLDSLGDVLMTTPAVKALKNGAPSREVTLLTSPAGAQLNGLVPEIDQFLIYESPWMKATPWRADPAIDLATIEQLRQGNYDAAVIFTVFSQNPLPAAMLCYLAGIPLRLAHCRENAYQLLTHRVVEQEPEILIRHEVRRQLDLVGSIGCRTGDERLSLRPPPECIGPLEALLSERNLDRRRPWLLVHPGASAPSRRYPPEHFASVARILQEQFGFQLVFTGSAYEQSLVERVRSELSLPSVSLAGELDLRQLATLINLAPLILTNNTGPAHLAAALGTPVVDLYALTNPQHTPWQVSQRVLSYDVDCKYCFKSECPVLHHDCLRRIAPQVVVRAVLELLEETAEARGECASVAHSHRSETDVLTASPARVDLEENWECIP